MMNEAIKMAGCWLFGFGLAVALLVSTGVEAKDYYGNLYSRRELESAYNTYVKNLRGIWKEDLLGRLPPQQYRSAKNIRLELPLIGINRHPFEYYADSRSRRVVIPILSIKFFDDLVTAAAWMVEKKCDVGAVYDYVGFIRYHDPTELPGGRFPPPLRALGVPKNVLKDKNGFVYDVSGKALKSGIYFLLAHELAHVLYGHQGYESISFATAQAQEIQADAFSFNLMRRIAVPPVGMVYFFSAVTRFEKAPGDYSSLREYEDHVRSRSTHPLTSERLLTLARSIEQNAHGLARLQRNPERWRVRIQKTASDIAIIGRILNSHAQREYQRTRSLNTSLAKLANSCR